MSSTSESTSPPAPAARPGPHAAALGGLGGLCAFLGYVWVVVGVAGDFLLGAAPGIAALGGAGVFLSGVAWRRGDRSWQTTLGLGLAWFPFAAGLILSIVAAAR